MTLITVRIDEVISWLTDKCIVVVVVVVKWTTHIYTHIHTLASKRTAKEHENEANVGKQ